MEKINVAELLKDCPRGLKLYSPIFGECALKKAGDYLITVVCDKLFEHEFYSDGSYCKGGECLLFPSQDQRDWSKFQRPFEDGDIVATTPGKWIGITKGGKHKYFIPVYCVIKSDGEFEAYFDREELWAFDRLATEEEKQKLFDAIKSNGYKWNAETKTLEKLHRFKVGDRVKKNTDYISGIVTDIFKDSFKVTYDGGCCSYVQFNYQHEWELVPNKFDITTLKPFESKVLVRDRNNDEWRGQFFSHYYKDLDRPYICIGVEGLCEYKQCIPFKGNECLLSTTNDCDEFYKTWE